MDTRYLTLPQGRIAYDDQGAGPVVICMPGIGDIRAEYRLLAPQLVAAGFRVVTMDPRGQGESDARWADYSVPAIAGDVLALARELRAGLVYLVGNSRAGAVAVWAAAEAPELVAGMALISPFARDNTTPRWQARLLYMALFAPLFSGPWGPAMWRRYLATLYPTGQPYDLAPYLDRVEAVMRQPGRLRALRATLSPTQAPLSGLLERVKAPTQVIFGTKDRDFASPETEARTVASLLGGPSRVELIEGAGHYPHAEMAAQTGELITGFLMELRDQRRAGGAVEVAHGA
jgi:pimeloyl-ACP methyl ester carboxylesterase